MTDTSQIKTIAYKPIGLIHTPYTNDWAPDQPIERDIKTGLFRVEIFPEYAEGLADLASFQYIYLLTALDRVDRPADMTVKPAWAKGEQKGLFATRLAERPNPIGLHVVRLLEVEGNIIHTRAIDLFDRTPLLDIKPYIKDLDSKDDADYGWLSDIQGIKHLMEHIRGLPHDHSHEHTHDHKHKHEQGGDHQHEHEHQHDHDHHHHHHHHHEDDDEDN